MILLVEYTKGNMFESDADCLINTVNCEGYMGKGIAYQFKRQFPENNREYEKVCKAGKLKVGQLLSYVENNVTIINFPTKDKWRAPSRMEYIENGMDALIELIPRLDVHKIAMPPLGCGNGGLEWSEVKKVVEKKIELLSDKYTFVIYEPSTTYKVPIKAAPKISTSGLVLLDIRLNLEKFNAIRLQKAGYFTNLFLQEEYFKFDKWKYGPYSHSIDIVARSIKEYQEYYGIDNSQKTYEQIYQVICSEKVDNQLKQLHEAVEKATAYVNRIKTDKMLEGVATALFIIRNGSSLGSEEVIKGFKIWSEDKAKRFSGQYIKECIDYLEETGMIYKDIFGNYQVERR